MRYIIIYVFDNIDGQGNPYDLLPGQMFEYDRCDDLETAQIKAKAFNAHGGHLLIVPYYEIEN